MAAQNLQTGTDSEKPYEVSDKTETSNIKSGQLIEGTTNGVNLATRQLESLKRQRCCSIAIANNTSYALINPRCFEDKGKVISIPLEIPSGHTGVIGAEKRRVFPSGTSGIITFRLENCVSSDRYIQLLWSVPYVGYNWVSVCLGKQSASANLFDRLYEAKSLRRADETTYTEILGNSDSSIEANVYMSTSSCAVLALYIKDLRRSTKEVF